MREAAAKVRAERNDLKAELTRTREAVARVEAAKLAPESAQEAEARQADEAAFEAVGKKVSETFAPFQKIAGDEQWNAQVDRLEQEAREFFLGSVPVEQAAEASRMAVGARVAIELFRKTREQLNAANRTIAKLTAGQPSAGQSTNGESRTITSSEHLTRADLDAARAREFESARAASRGGY
jgi:hypothetical protein